MLKYGKSKMNGASIQSPKRIHIRHGGDAVKAGARNDIENIAFLNWQLCANEKAYSANIITKSMYEYARNELKKQIEQLANICYHIHENNYDATVTDVLIHNKGRIKAG